MRDRSPNLLPQQPTLAAMRRLWGRTEPEGECLRIRPRYGSGADYPHVMVAGASVLARRVVYAVHYGDTEKRIYATCGNSWCVKPEHLSTDHPGLPSRQGQQHPMARLSRREVQEIRDRIDSGEKPIEIEPDYPVGIKAVWDIAAGRTWAGGAA